LNDDEDGHSRKTRHTFGGASEVHVKEPTGLQYLRLGDPRLAVSLGEGGYWIEQPKVIQDYLDHVLDCGDGRTKDQGGAVIALLSFADVRAIKAALLDFFREAAATPTE
jgi:hypothetical protein